MHAPLFIHKWQFQSLQFLQSYSLHFVGFDLVGEMCDVFQAEMQ